MDWIWWVLGYKEHDYKFDYTEIYQSSIDKPIEQPSNENKKCDEQHSKLLRTKSLPIKEEESVFKNPYIKIKGKNKNKRWKKKYKKNISI